MQIKFGAGRLYYAKMMAFVALVVWLPTSVTTAELMSGGDIRSSRALGTQTAAHTPASIKRSLRSNVDTTSDYTSNSEERVPPPQAIVRLSEVAPSQLWSSHQERDGEIIIGLADSMTSTHGNPLRSPHFPTWVKFIESIFTQNPELSQKMMLRILERYLPGDALIDALAAGTTFDHTKDIAVKLLDMQLRTRENHPNIWKLFEHLNLNLARKDAVFGNPAFFSWVNYVMSLYKNESEAIKVILMILTQHFKTNTVSALVAGTMFDHTRDIAEKLLDMQLPIWKKEKKNALEVFQLLELDRIKGTHSQPPAFMKWILYAKSLYPEDSERASIIMIWVLSQYYQTYNAVLGVLKAGERIDTTGVVVNELIGVLTNKPKLTELTNKYLAGRQT